MASKKELLEQSQKAIEDYFNLSKYLFGDDTLTNVNEIPKDSPFYEMACSLSDEMNLDWDNMSHKDSDRVMLNLLSEYFCNINVDEKYKPVLTISFQKVE